MKSPQQALPRVSVVIPAYRAAAYIGEALDSVVSQASDDVEILVVNDGSPDTPALLRALAPYSNRITYIEKENGGVSSARNAGIRAARGEWLAFLDADDVWMPNYLERQLSLLEANPEIDMVFPNGLFFGDTSLAGRQIFEVSPVDGEVTFLKALAGDCTISYCVLVRREIVLRAGLFEESLRGSEDFNLWLRILRAGGRLAYQREPLYRYRRHDASLTSNTMWMAERILESLAHSEATIPMSDEERAAVARHRRKVTVDLACRRAKAAFQQRDWHAALSYFERANELAPSPKRRFGILLLKLCPGLLYNVMQGRRKAALALSSL